MIYPILICMALGFPVLSLLLSSLYYFEYKNAIRAATLYGVAFFSVFYNYIPDSGNDSIRHMENLRNYINIPIWKSINAGPLKEIYVWDIWNWFVAQFNKPYLMPATGALVGYTISIYLILDFCKQVKLSNKSTAWILTIALLDSSPVGYAVGIRSANAYLCCILGMYLCEVKKKNKLCGIALMIVGILIHHSALLILALWVIFPIFLKNPKKIGVIIFLTLLSLTIISNYFLRNVVSDNILLSMITDSFQSVTSYQLHNSYNDSVQSSFKYKFETTLSFLMIALMLLRCRFIGKNKSKKNSGDVDVFVKVKMLSILFLIATCALMTVLLINGNRYTLIVSETALLALAYSYRMIPPLPRKQNLFIVTMFDISIMCCAFIKIALSIYTLCWGDASPFSLVGGMLGGMVYSLISGR